MVNGVSSPYATSHNALALYINGAKLASLNDLNSNLADGGACDELTIFRFCYNSPTTFTGSIARLHAYRGALTSDEVNREITMYGIIL